MRKENAIGERYAFFSLNLHFKLFFFFFLSFVYSSCSTGDHKQNLTRNEEKKMQLGNDVQFLFLSFIIFLFFYHLFPEFPSHLTRNKPLLEKRDNNATP